MLPRLADALTHRHDRRRRSLFRHPAQVVVAGFALVAWLGTALLMLPIATTDGEGAPFLTALFHSTSAVCVTGLATVDTPVYWSTFGELVIMGLIQVGGFGIMTLASLLGLLVSRHMGLRSRLNAAAETRVIGIGDVRQVLFGVFKLTLFFETTLAVLLAGRFMIGYDETPGRAAYLGVFHAISSFNNAGFALYSDNLMGFVTDPWICLPIAFGVIFGGLGFPVLIELYRQGRSRRRRRWSLHTRLTLGMTALLLLGGTIFITGSEWDNSETLGPLSSPGKILAGFFAAVMPRTAGFNSLDVGAMHDETLIGTIILMFIGGGSASTAGGIKVTTFILLFFVIWAEVRGEESVSIFDRRLDARVQRQALSVALLSVAAVFGSTLFLMQITDFDMEQVMFEVVSAFGTVGLSAGITPSMPDLGQLVLVMLMFLGRLGPVTLVSALALRQRHRLYEHAEGRPIIG